MKKPSIILSLLTVTAALATLPALGDLDYLKRDYTYLEKIPIGRISSYTDTYTDTKKRVTGNLLDNNKDTEWISWRENIIWAEDYNQTRYFSDFIVDGKNDVVQNGWTVQGTNKTTSITGNNLLLLNNRGGIYRQYRIFEPRAEYPELQGAFKAGTYKLKLRVKGDVAGSAYGFLGTYDATSPVHESFPVTTEWTEQEVTFTVEPGTNLSNAFCCVQPEGYAGTLEVDWAELSYEGTDSSKYNYLIDYNSYRADDNFTGQDSNLVTFENGYLVTLNPTGWFQFPTTPDLTLEPNTQYRITINLRGAGSKNNVNCWIGSKNSNTAYGNIPINITTSFEDKILTFTTPPLAPANYNPEEDTNAYFKTNEPTVVRIQVGTFEPKIEISGVTVEKVGGETITYNYTDFQHWPFSNGNEYRPALESDKTTGKTVARVTGSNLKSTDRFRFATGVHLLSDTYTLKARIKADSPGTIKLMIGSGAMDQRGNATISIPQASDDYVEYSVPIKPINDDNNPLPEEDYWIVFDQYNYGGNFSVESFELISDSDHTETVSWNIKNDGDNTYGTDNLDHREIKSVLENGVENSIIYSYPLPTTRKVIAAVGDGAHTDQQYENKAGFALENNHIYTVSYKIRSDRAGSVTTLLANSDDLNNANQSGNVWNNPIGTSDVVELEPDVTQTVYTTIRTTGAANSGAVVLDLGYNLGRVEVTDLKVMDNYDPNIREHALTTGTTQSKAQAGPYWSTMTQQQIRPLYNLSLSSDATYTVTVRLKATEAGKLWLNLGSISVGENFSASDDWTDVVFTISGVESTNSGELVLRLSAENSTAYNEDNYGGEITIQMVKMISSAWLDEVSKTIAWDYKGLTTYPNYSNYVPEIINDRAVITRNSSTPADKSWIFLKMGLDIEVGRPYRFYSTLVGTESVSLWSRIGNWGSNVSGSLTVPTTLQETYVQYPDAVESDAYDLLINMPDRDCVIQIERGRVVPNANDHIIWYSGESASNAPSAYWGYVNYQKNADGLQLNVQGNTKDIFDNLSLETGKSYMVEFDIQSTAGPYIVTLGNGAAIQTREFVITPEEAGKLVTKKVEFGSNSAETGTLTLTPACYTDYMDVKNMKVTPYTPAFNSGDKIGTDFFDVELKDKYTLDTDGKYLFQISCVSNGANQADGTPKNVMICGSSDGKNYERLGSYEVGEWSNGNAFVSTINNPMKNISDNMKYLRFYCLDNEGGETAICFPKDQYGNYDQDNAYSGSMMRMTRFGIYKQSTMFATDKAKYGSDLKDETYEKFDNWALPIITRFQIEALGQQYAYPGATLTDMLEVKKDVEVCGELFDNDNLGKQYARTTYWDTTWPLLKDQNLATDKYQYLEYGKFQYPADDDGSRDYDCIDLLLPDMEDLGVVKKLNGKFNDNGYYQIVVNLKRSTGYVDPYNNRVVYQITEKDADGNQTILSDETGEFKNRANGFPMEISYQGFTIGDNYYKNIHTLDNTEKVITFPNVAAGDSIQFALKVEKGWDGVRIFCRENTGNLERRAGGTKETNSVESDANTRVVNVRNNAPVPGTRMMRLAEIHAYVELDKIDLESETGRKRYDLLYNNREDFNTRKWKHTQGIIDDINNVNSVHDTTDELYMKKGSGGQTWKDVIDKYKDFFDEQGIEYPDFSLLNNPFNDEDVVPSNGMQRTRSSYDGQQRQRTYTILHEVLALPGERVDLYPQSDIWQPNGYNYQEQFVRWYDYLTDKAPDYLYFFAEPKSVIKTKDAGFIGGKTLLDHGLRGKGTVASVYFNTTSPNEDWSYDDKDTKRMKDQWVAADFSLAFNNKLQKRLGREDGQTGEEIQEPVINFRHLFHITSGSLFADRYMATAEGNQHYAKSNRRYISTFEGKTFRIRLEQAMPVEETTKSPFYYKTEAGEYKRVRGYDIYTYKLGENQKSDDIIKDIKFTAGGNDEDALKDNAAGANDRMFIMDDASIFPHIDSYVETTTDASKWLRNSKQFARSIKCDKDYAKKGRYLVRIYGKGEDRNLIHLKSEKGEEVPLVIAEYEVEFVDDLHASFLPEATLNALPEDDDRYHHTEKYLDDHYGNGKSDYKAVNFDKYAILKSDNVIVDKGAAPVNFKQYGFFESKEWGQRAQRLKLPIAWGNSNYGFGYSDQGDYNMFRLADHSAITAYRTAADKKPESENPYDTEWKLSQGGVYDRLFYNTNGTEKGLFYYVNAAADPGDMVKIDFDYFCPGSTIYVSGWVNEFNEGQTETANVIFNFYANVAKDENGVKTILRQEQIHGFATGYVNKNPDGSYESGVATGGDQGKWMHVYYSFVPDMNHADVIQADGEYIDSYYLVLENNCLSSSGADYAIDDIRAYVVAPRVEARQSNVLCEKDDSKIDIQVELPLESLEQSLVGQADENGIVHLQYSLVDKVIYDDYLEEVKKQHEGEDPEYQFTADDYNSAFAQGVLHYKHDNILTDNASGVVEYPVSWGVIDFYMDYKDKADTDVITVNGKTMTIEKYKEEYIQNIEGENCFVFTTHPVSQTEDGKENYNEFIKTHREYYVVVDNIGSTKVFSSLFYEYDEEGNLVKNSDETPVYAEGFSDKDLEKKNADLYPHKNSEPYEKHPDWEKYDKELAKAYQIGTDCARMSEFSLRSAAQIVVDGVLHETDDNITCCENQRPVVQINLKTRENNDTKNPKLGVIDGDAASENPYLDWWNGPFEEFAEQTSEIIRGKEKLSLWDILDDFRSDYPNADTWNVPTVEDRDADGNKLPTGEKDKDGNPLYPEKYTNAMRNYLKGLCATTKVDETTKETIPVEPKLVLHQSSYMFPQSKTILVDENGKKVKSKEIYVTAIPKSTPTYIEKDDIAYVICTQPREIKITVTNTSPTMFNGFLGITYPETIEDVPLRIGLKQLDKIVADKSADGNDLYVPLRNINPATFDVTNFHEIASNTDVYLVETNDPAYRQISDYTDPAEGETRGDYYNVDTRVVGKVKSISAEFTRGTDGSVNLAENAAPMAHIGFFTENKTESKDLSTGITFREGYYYKFRFHFEEGGSDMYNQPGFEVPCNGQTVFSIKVVPEYQIWTGDSSLNYNNDDNWRRVELAELLATGEAPDAKAEDKRFTIDGSNDRKFSYAPLNFTKVIIPAGATYPQLAPKAHSYDHNLSEIECYVYNGFLPDGANYKWVASAPDAIPVENMTNADKYNTGDHKEETKTQPTVYINYDMVAETYTKYMSTNNNVYCRPWYANACEQIHFNSNAEILNQQNLDYEKAWVDMEMTPHRWYNVASPLYGVVAGDMYLPAKKEDNDIPGRQVTELFKPIYYDTKLNDRFAPAVYQRGWDKGSETVYNINFVGEGSTIPGCPHVESVALASTWSHVYNDVAEQYTVGAGYSVKTDVTRLDNFKEDAAEDIKQNYVKFRFPKADTEFKYFKDGDVNEHIENTISREDKIGKLYNFESDGVVTLKKATVRTSEGSEDYEPTLFLVGNPFMAHLDMAKFLDKNKDVIAQKYWILSDGEGQVGVVMAHEKEDVMLLTETIKTGTITANAVSSNYEQLAPMQGFFVQALQGKVKKNESSGLYTLDIKFTPDMIAVQAYTDNTGAPILKAPAVRSVDEDIIRVSTSESTAIIRLTPAAEKGYAASEDVEMIDDSNQRGIRRIYTVAGTMASAINQTPDADGVEVGLMAPADSVTVVTFNGIALEDYMLYDTATGEKTQLYDGFELEMTGSVSGRYFLTNGVDTAEIEDGSIRIMPVGHEAVVTAPAVCGELTVRIFDTLGREVAKAEGFMQEVRVPLDPGIYAVEAIGSEGGRKSVKIQIH